MTTENDKCEKTRSEPTKAYCPACGTHYLEPAPKECDWCPDVQLLPVPQKVAA